MTNLLLGATAMAAFVPQVEGATEGVGALTNEIPGIVCNTFWQSFVLIGAMFEA